MDHYAVFGNPIQHSLSPFIHQLFAAQTQQELIYTKVLVPLTDFAKDLMYFQSQGGRGLSVTSPFKQEAFQLMDSVTERAALAKAVNTICIHPDGSRLGDNTDGIGLIYDLINGHKLDIQRKKILILGAGGAVRGILAPLLSHSPEHITVANRTLETANQLIKEFAALGSLSACSLSNIDRTSFDIIINSISAGAQGEALILPTYFIHEKTFCYDLVYSKHDTPFLRWAKKAGVTRLTDGLGMLVEQAAEAFYLWRGVKPNTSQIIQQLRKVYSSL